MAKIIELSEAPGVSLRAAVDIAMASERSPLLGFDLENPHEQFCMLAGVPSSSRPGKHPKVGPKTLYGRATRHYRNAKLSHGFMASFSNILLLSQVVLGATLTALGASESSHILITIFGVMNTIIAGLVAYLKSRGQPMRSRMYRDDLERVVDEIENSEIMWLGIAENIDGYDDIDVGDKVTVRSEVARLMRLYERAVRSNMMNNPDNYLLGAGTDGPGTALRTRPQGGVNAAPVAMPQTAQDIPAAAQPAPAPTPAAPDPDASPASAPPKASTPSPPKDNDAKASAPDTSRVQASKDVAKGSKPPEETPKKPPKSDPPATNDSKATLAGDPDAPAAPGDPASNKEDEHSYATKPDETPKATEDKADGDN